MPVIRKESRKHQRAKGKTVLKLPTCLQAKSISYSISAAKCNPGAGGKYLSQQ